MGILDLIAGREADTISWLNDQKTLNDDLQMLQGALRNWSTKDAIMVGESGTLYRYLQFTSWKQQLNKKFILTGTLKNRAINREPSVINLSQSELLTLDHSTSQWASAAVLNGDKTRLNGPPYKLNLTYEAVDHWNSCRADNKMWKPNLDETIHKQAQAFLSDIPQFIPEQAEDYCFARAFNLIDQKEGAERWPSLYGHESNRITEMEKALDQLHYGNEVTSRDHRVVQAIAMLAEKQQLNVKFKHPNAVNKSWPQFWLFLEYSREFTDRAQP